MSESTVSILIDSYSKQCKTFRKNAAGNWEPLEKLLPETYDLSWVNKSFFWYRLHKDFDALETDTEIQTNSSFIYECLSAGILNSNVFFKKFVTAAPEPAEDELDRNLLALEKFLQKSPQMSVEKIPVHISEGSRQLWKNFILGTEARFKSLYLQFEETDDLEKAAFLLIQKDEHPKYRDKNHSVCFAIENTGNSDINDIFPDEYREKGILWFLSNSKNSLMLLIKFFDFFYWKPRFIGLVEFCIKEAKLETLAEAQELIVLWRSCDKGFFTENNPDNNLYLLVDNSTVEDVKLTQQAAFFLYRFCDGTWLDNEGLVVTLGVPAEFSVGKVYDFDSDVRRLYKERYHAEAKDVFVFTPEKKLLSTIFSDNKSGKDEDIKPVKLRFRVVADGGADAFDVDCPGVRVRNGVYVYPLGSTQKFNVWIDNRREYNEKEHPLVCELDGRYYANSGEPERNAKKVIYHYEITFTEVRDYKFSALLAGMAGSVEYTFQVLPQPDTILGRLKPFLKRERQEIISVEHDSPVVDFCRAPVKKIKCFPGVEFVLNKAVFNKNYVPDATSKSIEDRIFNGEAACYAPDCSWQILDPKPEQICTLEKDQSRIKILECGSFKLQLKSLSQDLCQEIEFKVVSDKSGQMMKLLAVGLLISIIFFGWFGADFWIFLCKAFTPAVVYYAGTHSKECLKSPGQKILFGITLVISYWGLFRGLWQEI